MLLNLPTKYIVFGFIALVFIANILLLDYFFVQQRDQLLDFQTRLTQLADSLGLVGSRAAGNVATGSAAFVLPSAVCPQSCVQLIATAAGTTVLPTASLIAPVVQSVTSAKGEYFVPLGSGSITQTTNWTDISSAQAVFDAGNYGKIKAAYFEVFERVSNAGEVHARLFDVTTPAVFFNSDLSTNQLGSTFLSAPITLSTGSKTYRVQMYSTIGNGFLDQARIRVVVQ